MDLDRGKIIISGGKPLIGKIPVSGIRFEADCPGAGNGRDMFRLYDPEGVFIGVFRLEVESGKVRPVKMFYPS